MDITRWAGFFKPIDCLESYEAKRRVILAMTDGVVFVSSDSVLGWLWAQRGGMEKDGGRREWGRGTYYAAPRH